MPNYKLALTDYERACPLEIMDIAATITKWFYSLMSESRFVWFQTRRVHIYSEVLTCICQNYMNHILWIEIKSMSQNVHFQFEKMVFHFLAFVSHSAWIFSMKLVENINEV